MHSKYAFLGTDGELKKQLKARQCYPTSGDTSRPALLQHLADDMKRNDHSPVISNCKLNDIHCLVITNSMKPTQLVCGYHGAYSNSWAFLNFAQVMCFRASAVRLGICIVLPFGPIDKSERQDMVPGKKGPHVWYDPEAVSNGKSRPSRQASSRRAQLMNFIQQNSSNGYSDISIIKLVNQMQSSVDIACHALRIADCNVSVLGFDQGAVMAMELSLRLRTPPLFCVIWSTIGTTEMVRQAKIESWTADIKAYRTKSTQLLICHGESDNISGFQEVLQMRSYLNSHGYKTLSFTHGKGHEVPDQVQKVTIDAWLERIEKMARKGYPQPPSALRHTCSKIPISIRMPEKSELLSTGIVHTSVIVSPHVEAKSRKTRANDSPSYLPTRHPLVVQSPVRAPNTLHPEVAYERPSKNNESRFIHDFDLTLEDPEQFRYSQLHEAFKYDDETNNPTIFNVQAQSNTFGINSIWDPKGFQLS